MADNWQVGDLALCISRPPEGFVEVGGLYTVTDINDHWLDEFGLGLMFAEVPSSGPDWDGYSARRFRKIKPLTDAEREEALRDLKAPTREPAA